jgi:hypothetical protein
MKRHTDRARKGHSLEGGAGEHILIGALHLDALAEVRGQSVVDDGLTKVIEDLGATGDGRATPRPEVEAIGKKIAVRPHPWIAMQAPGAAVVCHGVDNKETPLGSAAEGGGGSDGGNAAANHQNVDMPDGICS